ncbi:MAG: cupin domain-containing protein [Halodesulfurarchaeum sp.]
MPTDLIGPDDAASFDGHCGVVREYLGSQSRFEPPEDVTIDVVDFYEEGAREHYHTDATEYYLVIEGQGTIDLEPVEGTRRTVSVEANDLLVVPPKTWHAGTPWNDTLTVVVFSPAEISDENTVIREE